MWKFVNEGIYSRETTQRVSQHCRYRSPCIYLDFTWICQYVPVFNPIYLYLPVFYLNLPVFTWNYLYLLEFAWIYLNLPGFTWILAGFAAK